jgi:metal-responsive CopG/Arc/MetJ family transcriptional regulator
MKPVAEEERMISIGFTVSLKMLKRIDELRGKEPRSLFIRRLLQRGLEAEFPEERGR